MRKSADVEERRPTGRLLSKRPACKPALLFFPFLSSLIASFLLPFNSCALDSPLIPIPEDLSPWELPVEELSDKQRWARTFHGIRSVPLHPSIWGYLLEDRTDSRRLVPMRRYYLRESLGSSVKPAEILVEFRLRKTTEKAMDKFPYAHDPYLEIGFNAEYEVRPHHVVDRGYLTRFSAFPGVSSGTSYFNRGELIRVSERVPSPLAVGIDYTARIKILPKKIEIVLNDLLWDEAPLVEGSARGLFIANGWSPVLITKLEVRDESARTFSGLVPLMKEVAK